jgi:putative ABC transport system permease protein
MSFQFWRRRQHDEELDAEIQSHLNMAARDRLERGESSEQARDSARREMGNVALVRETTREIWGWRWLTDAAQDLRFGMRMLRKNPGLSALLILTLAVGVGGTTAMYSVIEAVVLRPLPYVDDTRVMKIGGTNLKDLREFGASSFDVLTDYQVGGAAIRVNGSVERAFTSYSSENFFDVFRVSPSIGRTFAVGEAAPGGANVAVLSDTFWRKDFAGSTAAIGATIHVNGAPYTVIGVMPAGFTFPGKTSLWISSPAGWQASVSPSEQVDLPSSLEWGVLGRLRQGVTVASANAEMEALRQRMVRAYAGTNRAATSRISVNPVTRVLSRQYGVELYYLLAAGGFVLLIGCVNAAGLLLARGSVRRREIAVRLCLGAGRWRVARQLLSESFVLAALSSIAGVGLAWMLVALIRAYGPPDVPRLSETIVNARALFFALGIAQVAGILAALWPAFRSSGMKMSAALHPEGPKDARRMTQRGRRFLTIAEIALALILAIGAGVAMRSLHDTLKADLNFQAEQVLTMRVSPSLPDKATRADGAALRYKILEEMQGLPGLVAAAEVQTPPFSRQSGGGLYLDIDGKRGAAFAEIEFVDGDYFAAYGLPLLAGRALTRADTGETEPVVVINETLAKLYGGPANAIGKQLRVEGPREIWKIAGVVPEARVSGSMTLPTGQIFFPFDQIPQRRPVADLTILVRVTGNPTGLETEIRKRLARVLGDSPVFQVRTLDAVVLDSVATPRFDSKALAAFAGVAILLALVGIYGVVAFSVTQRTHEIGVRMALGASPAQILRLVIGEGVKLGVAGIAVGLGIVLAFQKIILSLLFGVKVFDAETLVIASAVLLGATLLACAVPARRASRVHPTVALRYE